MVKNIEGQQFGNLRVLRRAANNQCHQACWECLCACGQIIVTVGSRLRLGKSKSCGCSRLVWSREGQRGASNPAWKSGWIQTAEGYIKATKPGHPRADSRGYAPSHILVYEAANNCTVPKGFTIHHKNGVKNDNRPANLELWVSGHGPGQRVVDLLASLNPEHLLNLSQQSADQSGQRSGPKPTTE